MALPDAAIVCGGAALLVVLAHGVVYYARYIREDESGCDIVWTSPERSPSTVAKLSAASGLALGSSNLRRQSTGSEAATR